MNRAFCDVCDKELEDYELEPLVREDWSTHGYKVRVIVTCEKIVRSHMRPIPDEKSSDVHVCHSCRKQIVIDGDRVETSAAA